jgi:cysteine desulfuration protein SufE
MSVELVPNSADRTITEIESEFAFYNNWEDRYAHIIEMGRRLTPYPEPRRSETYKVRGCTSQVWLYPTYDGQRVHFEADSDAVIVKGLVAMLLRIFNHHTPAAILAVPVDFVQRLGLNTHLSPSRANGLASMIKQIKLYAVAYQSTETGNRKPETGNGKPETGNRKPEDEHRRTENESVSGFRFPVSALRDKVIDALHTVFDPEIPIDIYELGLIYEVRVSAEGKADILMTLTTPNCPSAQTLPADVERAAKSVPSITAVDVQITFDPPWDKTMMSEAALFSIGLF